MITKLTAVRPTWMIPGMNGNLPVNRLTSVYVPHIGHVSMENNFARQWNWLAVMVNGELVKRGYGNLRLTLTDATAAYRSHLVQERVFYNRMTRVPLPGLVRVPYVTRRYKGATWYLKVGKAPCAAPEWLNPATGKYEGGSNHGWASAADNAWYNVEKGIIVNIAGAGTVPWIIFRDKVNAAGMSWEGDVPVDPYWTPGKPAPRTWEPWHTRNVVREVPEEVVALEKFFAGLTG